MKIVVVSDSHGNIENLNRVKDKAVEVNASAFIHLGDNYDDVDAVDFSEIEVIKVPGTRCPEYLDKPFLRRIIKDFDGWSFLISHMNELPENSSTHKNIDVILHGHTHKPEIYERNGIIRINPGHLIQCKHRGYEPTYCILEVNPEFLVVNIFFLKNDEVFETATLNRKNQI